MPKKIFAAMSGGVDSSVAAYLLTQAGYEVTGATMTLYRPNGETGDTQDVTDARAVCAKLGIPHKTYDMGEVFCRCVIEDFIRVYEEGGTPNPCIDCNRHLKFDQLMRRAEELGCDCVVTGHYARIRQDETSGRYLLYKAKDAGKDQTYFLASLNQHQLAHILFPLGSLTKTEAREIAEKWNKRYPDSQYAGYVTSFEIDDGYISQFPVQTVGAGYHQELWIPAEELENFNRHIIGTIAIL